MASLENIFRAFPEDVNRRYFSSAVSINEQLAKHVHYHLLGGKRLVIAPNLIRFKLGNYRLIFQAKSDSYQPLTLIHRKNLTSFLKRR